jgi:hypothetical protein
MLDLTINHIERNQLVRRFDQEKLEIEHQTLEFNHQKRG